MKAKLFKTGHVVKGKMAEILVRVGKAEFIEESEIETSGMIEEEAIPNEIAESEPEVKIEIAEKVVKPVKKQKVIIQKIEPKVRKKRTVKVKK